MGLDKVGHTAITWPFTPDGAAAGIRAVGQLGYRGIELFGFVIDAYPGGVAGVRADLDRAGVELAAAYCSVSLIEADRRDDDVSAIVGWAQKVKSLGGDVVVVGASPSTRSDYSAEDYQGLCVTLDEIGRRCADLGVKACFHPHTGTPVESRQEIARVMEGVDPAVVFMAPDTGQIAKGGADPVEVVRTYASMVEHIHLKDYLGWPVTLDAAGELIDRSGYLDYVPLGEGVVDIPGIVNTLDGAGFAGWWMVELDGTPAAPRPPQQAAAISKAYLDARLDGIGA